MSSSSSTDCGGGGCSATAPTRRRIELTPTTKPDSKTELQEAAELRDKCTENIMYSAELAWPYFNKVGVFFLPHSGISVTEEAAPDREYVPHPKSKLTPSDRLYPMGIEKIKWLNAISHPGINFVKKTPHVFLTTYLNTRGFKPTISHPEFFHVTFHSDDGSHIIGGFITPKRVVILHHYRSKERWNQNMDYYLKAYIESQGQEVVFYPPEDSEIDIQKTDNQTDNIGGLCQRWFLILPYAIAMKLGTDKANWERLGDSWEGSLVKEVYDEFNANPIRARYKYTHDGMDWLSGGRRKTLSQKLLKSTKRWKSMRKTLRLSKTSQALTRKRRLRHL